MEPDSRRKPNESENVPLPATGISEILGLLELLRAKGGRDDIYKLANELQMEYGEILAAIKGAELLGFVHTPGGDVVLERLGEKVTRESIPERKAILAEQLEKIPVFRKVTEHLHAQEDHEMTRDEVLEKLAELIPNEDAEQTFSTLIHWGRYAELFGYNDDSHAFYLDTDETEEAS
jgi:NitT/TauT family transport system ATP-binding protein